MCSVTTRAWHPCTSLVFLLYFHSVRIRSIKLSQPFVHLHRSGACFVHTNELRYILTVFGSVAVGLPLLLLSCCSQQAGCSHMPMTLCNIEAPYSVQKPVDLHLSLFQSNGIIDHARNKSYLFSAFRSLPAINPYGLWLMDTMNVVLVLRRCQCLKAYGIDTEAMHGHGMLSFWYVRSQRDSFNFPGLTVTLLSFL